MEDLMKPGQQQSSQPVTGDSQLCEGHISQAYTRSLQQAETQTPKTLHPHLLRRIPVFSDLAVSTRNISNQVVVYFDFCRGISALTGRS